MYTYQCISTNHSFQGDGFNGHLSEITNTKFAMTDGKLQIITRKGKDISR